MTPTELIHAKKAFLELTKIGLLISGMTFDRPAAYEASLNTGNVAKILSTARHLRDLSLAFDNVGTTLQNLTITTGEHVWPGLRNISLENVPVKEDQLIQFFLRHEVRQHGANHSARQNYQCANFESLTVIAAKNIYALRSSFT